MSEPVPRGLLANRFEVRRRLGSGGFGEVYEAFDRDRAEIVAVKVLRRTDADALYRFKQEFRTLANLAHRNLVTLHELISVDEEWLLTMELVRGVSFVDYVRPPGLGAASHDSTATPSTDVPTVSQTVAGPATAHQQAAALARTPLPLDTLDLDRLRAALRELAEGVIALHQNGILHLDIKPSNVLVAADGRVVLVDFGLAQELGPQHDRQDQVMDVVGTPEFMSPEQASGRPPTESSDWYCVGAMLYRALTGLPTFSGSIAEVIGQKRDQEPVPAATLLPGVPSDLDSLCRDLLRRDHKQRPSRLEVLTRLGASPTQPDGLLPDASSRSAPFVGRTQHLAALRSAFDQMKRGLPAAIHVHGRSGMGKTALVRRFLQELRESEREAVILEGRCYEHEAVPFKAFDALLDGLGNHLQQLPDSQVAALLPRGVEQLSRIFPSLKRVAGIASAQERTRAVADPSEQRRRAFAALREFFGRVAERQPLVLVIDDLQWGDVDSAALLDELLRPPDPPSLLLIACYRDDEKESSACLRALLAADASRASAPGNRIEVSELSPAEAQSLAAGLLPQVAAAGRAETIARDTQGNPFFIDQLARHSQDRGPEPETLEAVLWNRTARLPDASRRFMEVVAIAGSPVELAVAARAADVETGKYDLFASLRSARLVRSRSRRSGTEVEPYHDRIRETIVSRLLPDVRQRHHLRLAQALEAANTTDLEALTLHFRDGGDPLKARHYAIAAAQQSADALAFDGAARLYSLAIDLHPEAGDASSLRVKLGDALAMTGRVTESAAAYLAAVSMSSAVDRVELQRRAGEQYLLGFQLEQGLALLESLLAETGMRLASNMVSAGVAAVLRRWYLRWRGTAYVERRESDVPAIDLQRLDMCHALCRGMGFTDTMRAIELQTRHLELALKVGEPYRVARALTLSATADGLNNRSRPGAERLLAQAREIAERIQNPYAIGIVHSATGLINLGAGRWWKAIHEFDQAETTFRDRCIAPPHTTMLCHLYRLDALCNAGALTEYFRKIPEYFAESQGRGDVHAEGHLRMRQAHLKCFASDDPEAALEELRTTEAGWGERKLVLSRAYLFLRQIEVTLYSGDLDATWDLINRRWRMMLPLRIFGFQALNTMAHERRAYCALGLSARSTDSRSRERSLKIAEGDARAIDGWEAPWGVPIAHLIRAGVAATRHEDQRAADHLSAAEHGFTETGMALHLAVTRWRRGTLLDGDEGRALVDQARGWMREQGVQNPDRMGAMIAPDYRA